MNATAATDHTAKKRPRKTRTRSRPNNLPPLHISKIAAHEYDLTPDCVSLVCPACRTWVPINRPHGRPGRTRLVPHHTTRAGTPNPVLCEDGSHRRVIIDLTIPQWRQRLADGITDTAARRPTTVLPKPKTPQPPAATRITPIALTAAAACTAYTTHLKRCAACTGRTRCPDGTRLADTYARLTRQEPHRAQVRGAFARERARFDRVYMEKARQEAAAEWAERTRQDSQADKTNWAKHAGTAVEEANNTCRTIPGAVSEYHGPDLPITPQHITR